MRDIKVFENMEFGKIRTVEQDGKLWFCGADVADSLEYKNSRDAIARHCRKGGVAKHDIPTVSGIQSVIFINEPNLYRLITHSKLPQAEKFEKWVFEEVLPSIRKTGGYATAEQIEQLTQIVEGLTKIVTNLTKAVEKIMPRLEEKQVPIKDKLRYARKSKGLTQKQMSDVVRIPYRTYAKYEQGACNPSKKRTLLLAQFIDLILGIQ